MINKIKTQIKTASYEASVIILSEYIQTHPSEDEPLTLRGLKHWGAGHHALAIKDYLAAIAINPQSRAQHALRVAREILDYRNTDLINP